MVFLFHFQIDTPGDQLKDKAERGGNERRGDLTRPLKNRKVRWLFRHWWNLEGDFIWYDHGGKGVTYQLSHESVMTLRPSFWLEDEVVNAYGELLRLREISLWKNWSKYPITEQFKPQKYFIAPSFMMVVALHHCPNLKVVYQ